MQQSYDALHFSAFITKLTRVLLRGLIANLYRRRSWAKQPNTHQQVGRPPTVWLLIYHGGDHERRRTPYYSPLPPPPRMRTPTVRSTPWRPAAPLQLPPDGAVLYSMHICVFVLSGSRGVPRCSATPPTHPFGARLLKPDARRRRGGVVLRPLRQRARVSAADAAHRAGCRIRHRPELRNEGHEPIEGALGEHLRLEDPESLLRDESTKGGGKTAAQWEWASGSLLPGDPSWRFPACPLQLPSAVQNSCARGGPLWLGTAAVAADDPLRAPGLRGRALCCPPEE